MPAPSDRPLVTPDGRRIYVCDLCGAVMLDLHCKLSCPGCGYKRDCSDP